MRRRIYVTGTDTDVGKTLVCGALARALMVRDGSATVVKIVQTGLTRDEPGDAQVAGTVAGCGYEELARFAKPADPWTAALAAGAKPLSAAVLANRIDRIEGPLVVEGSGGAAVPLNESESISDVAFRCGLEALLVVGLRLGCINHALLTLEFLERRGIGIYGLVLSRRWPGTAAWYARDVERILASRARCLGTLAFNESLPARESQAFELARKLL